MLTLPAVLQSVKTLSDGGVAMNFHSQELKSAEMALIFELKGGLMWLGLQKAPIKDGDIEIKEIVLEGKYKSPSQEQRAILYRIWEKSGSDKVWEEYYIIKMSEINNKLREHLN